jgi:putative hydrolase of the HAD superfamily
MQQRSLRRSDYAALTFDVYGTLIDWERGLQAYFEPWAAAHGLTASAAELLAAYDRLRGPVQNVRPAHRYGEVLRRSFDALTAEYDVAVDAAEREQFLAVHDAHPPFPDSRAGLRALKARGLVLGAYSNADSGPLAAVCAQLGDPFDVVVSAERVGAYKPDKAHFMAGLADLQARGIPMPKVLHVAHSRRADIVPANELGLTCVWVNRAGSVLGRRGGGAETAKPDFEFASLEELAATLA